ncbi:MAG: glycoside hydrolase family protein [Candidatus Velthaea sp.]
MQLLESARRAYSMLAMTAALSICGCSGAGSVVGGAGVSPALPNNGSPLTTFTQGTSSALGSKSVKRGVAYDFAVPADLAALAPGVSWWYNWTTTPNAAVPADYTSRYGMDYYPMLWNGNFDATATVSFLAAHPTIKYILVLNEPNLTGQANLTPSQAAQIWPRYEAVAASAGVKIVGPALTWGTMPGFQDPVVWLDAFYAAYRSANNRDPQIDFLAFHWYDYGLSAQLDRLAKYGKPVWVTELANWHSKIDGKQIDTLAKQEAQMTDMVATCENRADVFRYAWFTGRVSPDPHFDSLLGAQGALTELGALYISLPHP